MQITKLFFLLFLMNILNSCGLNKANYTEGLTNLEERQKLLTINKTNKNDVVSLLGEAVIKEYPNESRWVFIENVKKKSLTGSSKTIKNNLLLLEFNTRGILVNKKLLVKKDMKKLKFDKDIQISQGVNSSFSKKFFTTIKKRMSNKLKSLND